MTLISLQTLIGQTQQQLEREKNKVDILTVEERANLQLLFYKKTKAMQLSDEVEEEYYRYLLHYLYDMQRLNDKDMDYTESEIKIELEKLITKMNTKIKPVLKPEQFETHLRNFDALMKVVYFKYGWNWDTKH